MNLQDELTKEFLSWVLGKKGLVVDRIEDNILFYLTPTNFFSSVNLDTLTRLIKEKIVDDYNIIETVRKLYNGSLEYIIEVRDYQTALYEEFKSESELEAVIKAGKYVWEKVRC